MAKQFIISIGREYGSGGRVIAEHLAKTLNVKFYDKNIIEHIAQEKKLNLDQLKKYDEKARNIWLSRSVDGLSNSPEDTIAQMQFDFLKERAQAGESFVVLGRCASYILRDFDCMIKVFVTSDMHHKMERIASIEHLDPVMVEDMIIKNNKKEIDIKEAIENRKGLYKRINLKEIMEKAGIESRINQFMLKRKN